MVYCDDFPCTLSVKSAEKMIGLGYSNTFVLDGGLGEWERRGYPVVKGDANGDAVKVESLSAEKARPRIAAGTLQAIDVRPPLELLARNIRINYRNRRPGSARTRTAPRAKNGPDVIFWPMFEKRGA